jgi:hypothetical protein
MLRALAELAMSARRRRATMAAKVLCVLYDDPVGGYPKSYPRPGIPTLEQYPNGQSMPNAGGG